MWRLKKIWCFIDSNENSKIVEERNLTPALNTKFNLSYSRTPKNPPL